MATNFNKLFVYVPTVQYESFKSAHLEKGTNDKYYNKITFFEKTGELMTHGKLFAINTESETLEITQAFAKLSNLVGQGELGSGESTIVQRISSLETLLSSDADANSIIDRISEVINWFNNISESETGASLLSDVSNMKTAIGNTSVAGNGEVGDPDYVAPVAATGIYKELEDNLTEANTYTTNAIAALDAQISFSDTKNYATINLNEVDGKLASQGSSLTIQNSVLVASQDDTNPATLTYSTAGFITTDNLNDIKTFIEKTALQKAAAAANNIDLSYYATKEVTGNGTETSGDTLTARIYALEQINPITSIGTGSDTLIDSSESNGSVTISSKQKLTDAVALAESSLQRANTETSYYLSVSYSSGLTTINAIVGSISVGQDSSLLVNNGDENKLATVGNIATAINQIDMWEEVPVSEPQQGE